MTASRLAIDRGLNATRDLFDHGDDGHRGRLDLGLDFGGRSVDDLHIGGRLDASYRLSRGWGELSAFGQAFGRMTRDAAGWSPEFGGIAGLRLEF